MNAIPSNKCGNIVDAKMWICSVSRLTIIRHTFAFFSLSILVFKFMDACVFVCLCVSVWEFV